MLYPLKFSPIFMDRIWGGKGLKEEFGKEITKDKTGESWEISCRKDAMSLVAEGPLKGKNLGELITEYGSELLGSDIPVEQEFPLLLKILDAQDILSVQVHPDDEFAEQYENSLGKTEVWYVFKAQPGAKIVYGLKTDVTRQKFEDALQQGAVEECLNEVEVKPGEVYPVPAGVVHALGAGIIVAEFQQNSDLTYRVFDWNRFDQQGRSRPLHIEKALRVIDFNHIPSPGIKPVRGEGKQLLVENKHFSLELNKISGEKPMVSNEKAFSLGMVGEGTGSIIHKGNKYILNYGDSFMIPATIGEYSFCGEFTVLIGTPK